VLGQERERRVRYGGTPVRRRWMVLAAV